MQGLSHWLAWSEAATLAVGRAPFGSAEPARASGRSPFLLSGGRISLWLGENFESATQQAREGLAHGGAQRSARPAVEHVGSESLPVRQR